LSAPLIELYRQSANVIRIVFVVCFREVRLSMQMVLLAVKIFVLIRLTALTIWVILSVYLNTKYLNHYISVLEVYWTFDGTATGYSKPIWAFFWLAREDG
jgi:hypothetical protein